MDPSAARTCATCCAQRLLSEPAFQLCAGCRKVAYCSRGCQRAGWAAHKPRCASQNLLRAHYSEDGLTLTFTLKDLITFILLPEPGGSNFWRTYMAEYAADHRFDPTKLFTIGLRPPQSGGGDWAYAVGGWTPSKKVPWNEQAALVITLAGKPLTTPCSASQPYTPFVEAKSLIRVPHNAGNQFQDISLAHRIVCNGCMMVWAQGGGMGCRGGTAETPAL